MPTTKKPAAKPAAKKRPAKTATVKKTAVAPAPSALIDPVRSGWKVFTHDGCPPVQGGPSVWNGELPKVLPVTTLDTSSSDCAAGWNYCGSLTAALRIAGLWPNGRPSRAVLVEASTDAIRRGDKNRASSLTLIREATDIEIEAAVRQLSAPFGPFLDEIVAEQLAWRRALARPKYDETVIEDHLRAALAARGLNWTVKRYAGRAAAWAAWAAWDAWDARAARDAWDAWDARAARAAWDAWDARAARAARAAWAARAARAAWDAWDARAAWDAWDARDARAARAAWDAWDARDAWDALVHMVAVKNSWLASGDPLVFTVGIRDAYEHGLAIALPTGPNEMGYAMIDPDGGRPMTGDEEIRERARVSWVMKCVENAVFVFGSNLAGAHGGGAAREAVESYGAVMGDYEGLQGRSYAIPTMDRDLRPLGLTAIAGHVRVFLDVVARSPDRVFAVTRIGCGIAGYSSRQIAPMFASAPSNCDLPEGWRTE